MLFWGWKNLRIMNQVGRTFFYLFIYPYIWGDEDHKVSQKMSQKSTGLFPSYELEKKWTKLTKQPKFNCFFYYFLHSLFNLMRIIFTFMNKSRINYIDIFCLYFSVDEFDSKPPTIFNCYLNHQQFLIISSFLFFIF